VLPSVACLVVKRVAIVVEKPLHRLHVCTSASPTSDETFGHKITRQLVDTYRLIALEDLTLNFMTANHHLALSTYDAGLSEFQQLLAYKAESAGTRIVTVNPAYTSQVCSECGAIAPKDLRIRVHVCPDCGLTLDRDVNAARNILMLAVNAARTGPPGRNVAGIGERVLGSSLL